MMINKKIYKPIETQEQCNEYTQVVEWCNANNAHIEDKGEYYEVVENEVIPPAPPAPSQLDIIEAQVMYTALMTDTLIEEV